MRILHLVNSLDQGSGITNVVVDLSVTQHALGDEVLVSSRCEYYSSFLLKHGVGFSKTDFSDRNVGGIFRAIQSLRKTIDAFHPEIIHVHTIAPLILCRLMRVRIPIVATVHNEWQRRANLMRFADQVVAVSPSVAISMVERGVPTENITTIANGTTGSPRRPKPVKPARLGHPAVLFVGSLRKRKGTDVLLDAFRIVHQRIPFAQLYLVGNNDLPVTNEMLTEMGIEAVVHLEGQSDPYPYYESADVFVLPSRREPAALVLLEAMESGLPIIGTRVGGTADFLEGEEGGLCVPSEDSRALGEAIISVVCNSEVRESLAQRGRRVASRHTVEHLVEQYSAVYRKALLQ